MQARVTRPFQFANLRRLDEEVDRAVVHAAEVEGLRATTIRCWRLGYKQLRVYLEAADATRVFVRGEPDAQARVLEGWIAWLRGRGAQHGTVRSYWCAVHSLFDRFARIDGIWNPLWQFRRPKAAPPVPRALSRDDAERLLAYLSHARGSSFDVARNLAIVACMVFAGLRRGEILRLDLKHVSRASRTLRIERSKGRDGGKTRTAYMPRQLTAALCAYEHERERAGYAIMSPYFVSSRTGERLKDGAVRRMFATVRTRTGLNVSPHMLRHTYVTLLRQSGVADRITMDLAGHASLAMTQRYSTVFSGEHLAAADQLSLDFE